jgi:hypothetical protein
MVAPFRVGRPREGGWNGPFAILHDMDTARLDTMLARLPTLGEEAVRVLHATWDGGDVELRMRAWQHGKRLLADQRAEATYRAASEQVQRWARDYTSGRTGLPYELDQSFRDIGRLDLRIAAAPALLDAILASLVGDALEGDERDELLAPWLEATGVPAPVGDAWADPDGPPTRIPS